MWPEIAARLPRFSSAVLTGLDSGGDPVSVRCHPTLDHQAQVLRVAVPDGLEMVTGPAGLLCHHHDEQLWGLKSFLLRGTLDQTSHGWAFRPRQLVPGMDTTPLRSLRLLRDCRRTAKAAYHPVGPLRTAQEPGAGGSRAPLTAGDPGEPVPRIPDQNDVGR
jgi:hypothetical protein